ncbi:MAG TPA: CDP-alcohol phosphatidyltransferase family protein [Vicinamibacterales bacterium]|nr:CDP-alcohol phosphatidyltransferase family protein [Vicinamibacterales bacterium]
MRGRAIPPMTEANPSQPPGAAARILPWLAHLYTSTGVIIALFATAMTFAHNFRAAFLWLVLATIVDATDGVLARAFKVKQRLPQFDGALLDNLIDYLTYVFVPALIVWQADLVASPFPVCAAMLVASLYGFAHTQAKVEGPEYFFTGFPSYWNIVVAYLYMMGLSQRANAIVLVALAVLVFVPIRYIYPSRTIVLRVPTLVLGTMWAALFAWMVWRLPAVDGPWALVSLIFPAYYVALSLWLQFRRS